MSEYLMADYGNSGHYRQDLQKVRTVLPTVLFIAMLTLVLPASASVFMYPGAGNGTIQDLINRTSSGDSVYIVPGTYHENLVIDRGIVFGALDTENPAVIVASGSRPGIQLAADGITLNGLVITGTAPTGLIVQSNNNRISDITVQGFERGVELSNAGNNILSKNTITNNSIGIVLDRSSRSNTLFLNRFDNTADVAGQASDVQWFTTRQDYTYNGSGFTGPLGNYWKAYTGVDSNGNGVGDTAYPISGFSAAPASTATEISDRAPLVGLPEAYTLLVRNASSLNATDTRGSEKPPDLVNDRQQLQQEQQTQQLQQPQNLNPPASVTPGGQAPFTGENPGSAPGNSVSPPGTNALPRILLDFWWAILIVVLISVIGGVAFERSRRNVLPPASHIEYVPVSSTGNATMVKRPGTGGSSAGNWKDQSYYAAHLPPALEKKYPDAEYRGEGGVGRVFRAWDPCENRPVAVKIPIRFDEITGTQFTKELHIWQGLHHKNIVEIYAANVFPMPYIEMEYIESSLASLKFPLDTERAVRIITGVAEGLQYAHTQGIVHRDIKPENILITADDVPKITDWGLAKALTDTKQTGLISFSLNYAAPEQLAPNLYGEAGKWTDIYQLGVLLYEMVTGRLPFTGDGMGEVTQAILHNTPLPPEPAGRNADAIRSIITKCLQKKPQDRYASVTDILADLRHLTTLEG